MVRKLGKVWRYNGDLWGYYGFNMEEVNRIYVANIILHSPRFLLGCLSLFGKIITSRDPNPDTLFWHSFWHAVWKYVSHILFLLSYIYFDILSDNLSRIYSDIPAGIYCDILSGIPKTTFYLASIMTCYLAFYLTFHLAFYSIFYLTYFLTIYLAFYQNWSL